MGRVATALKNISVSRFSRLGGREREEREIAREERAKRAVRRHRRHERHEGGRAGEGDEAGARGGDDVRFGVLAGTARRGGEAHAARDVVAEIAGLRQQQGRGSARRQQRGLWARARRGPRGAEGPRRPPLGIRAGREAGENVLECMAAHRERSDVAFYFSAQPYFIFDDDGLTPSFDPTFSHSLSLSLSLEPTNHSLEPRATPPVP